MYQCMYIKMEPAEQNSPLTGFMATMGRQGKTWDSTGQSRLYSHQAAANPDIIMCRVSTGINQQSDQPQSTATKN